MIKNPFYLILKAFLNGFQLPKIVSGSRVVLNTLILALATEAATGGVL